VLELDWREELTQIFGAHVRQDSLESGALEMASLAKAYPDLDARFLQALSKGIEAARRGDRDVCRCVESSGYYAPEPQYAEELIMELRRLYIQKCSLA
jgi:hypothetical protein